jgi:hypothetical protein
MGRFFHLPGDWLAHQTTAQDRRSLAAWAFIFAALTVPVRYIFKDEVWMVWLLSELAFVLALLSIITTETPVEPEEKLKD